MGEVVSYTKAAIDEMVAGGVGGGGGITQQQLEDYAIPISEKAQPNGVATLDATGLIPPEQIPGGGGGGGSSKVEVTAFALGNMAGGAGAYTWVEVPNVCKRGLLSRLTINSDAATFDFELRDAAAGGGELWLAADNNPGSYDISAPVYIEGDDTTSSLWIGIRNTGVTAATFTLQNLRVEAFA